MEQGRQGFVWRAGRRKAVREIPIVQQLSQSPQQPNRFTDWSKHTLSVVLD